jgi:hypothetical protein
MRRGSVFLAARSKQNGYGEDQNNEGDNKEGGSEVHHTGSLPESRSTAVKAQEKAVRQDWKINRDSSRPFSNLD